MSERSGISMIEELLQEVKMLRKEIKVLDKNVKIIANSAKISELATKAMGTKFENYMAGAPNIQPAQAPQKKPKTRFKFEKTPRIESAPEKSDMCMCSGKVMAEFKGKMISLGGLDVKIYDDNDKVVKQTKTNTAGRWAGQLPPGQYVANIEGKYGGKDLYPVNIPFTIKPGTEKFEVK